MPRKKTFDEHVVLRSIAKRFWAYGFKASSLDQISRETGLTKTSLYNAYGGKNALFKKAVDVYVSDVLLIALGALTHDRPVIEEIRETFYEIFVHPGDEIVSRGCLVTNSVLELAETEPDLHAHVVLQMERVRLGVESYLEAARRNGRVSSDIDAARTAQLLFVALQGLRVYARMGHTRAELKRLIDDLVGQYKTELAPPV